MRKSQKSHTIDVIFVLALACTFAASILMVLMLGVNFYADIQKSSNEEFNDRVCLSYITAKIHSNDRAGHVEIGSFEGIHALFMYREFDDEMYNTIIYVYDGWLMELFAEKDLLPPESGTPVLELESITFENVTDDLLSVEYLDAAGKSGKVYVNLRSEGGSLT